ncbi:MAG: helix-turn-helix domain-containing protein [Treponema sp.]|nr:helix-turn-helix domain-containing protein [Treponema sp.]
MKEKTEKIRQILAQNIKKRRENLGFSQEKLAEMSELSVQAINTVEGCRMWISDKSITRIAKALDVEIFQLFVPYHSGKWDMSSSPSFAFLELRQNILNDTEIFCLNIDKRIKDVLKIH